MSKLKTAKAIRKSFIIVGTILKWTVLTTVGLGLAWCLWAWAVHHFLSFAIICGIILAVVLIGTIGVLWEWSDKTIEEAEKEERRAQERNRVEKERKENPGKYVPDFDDDYDDHNYR